MVPGGSPGLAQHPLVNALLRALAIDAVDLPEEAEQWIRENPVEAPRFLLSLVGATTLRAEHALGDGQLPSMAATLLGRLKQPSTVEPLLEILAEIRHAMPDAMLRQPVWDALLDMGELVVEPALDVHRRSDSTASRRAAAMLLGDIAVTDARVFDVLVAALSHTPCAMAAYLAGLQDERALPPLLDTFDALPVHASGEYGPYFPGQPLFDLYDAITACSGQLSDERWDKYQRALSARYPRTDPIATASASERNATDDDTHPVHLSAATMTSLCRQALQQYRTVRKASQMIRMSIPELWQYACFQAD